MILAKNYSIQITSRKSQYVYTRNWPGHCPLHWTIILLSALRDVYYKYISIRFINRLYMRCRGISCNNLNYTILNAWHMWGEGLSPMAITWYEIKTNKFLWFYILTLILRSTTVYGFWKIVDVLQTSNSKPVSKKNIANMNPERRKEGSVSFFPMKCFAPFRNKYKEKRSADLKWFSFTFSICRFPEVKFRSNPKLWRQHAQAL